jgi:hypothetical protein
VVNQISLANLLLVLFVAFKLAGIITWSWVWVLSPLWIALAVLLLVAVLGGVAKLVTPSGGRP